MLAHVILGMMRDGRVWHGYALGKEYRRLSGSDPNEGNVYTKLAQLSEKQFIVDLRTAPAVEASSVTDPGNRGTVSYRITDKGRREFDAWLLSPQTLENEPRVWLLFLDLVPPETLDALLEREKERRIYRCKSLAHQLEDAQADSRLNGRQYHARVLLLQDDLKHATRDLEAIGELQHEVKRLREVGILPR
jgi:DNA-binding PadR family transcriptional regulator